MSSPKKIVLLQLLANGDCLYATAVARQIKHDYPGGHLTWVIAAQCKRIIDNNPYVDTVWEVPGVNRESCTGIIHQLKREIKQKIGEGVYDKLVFTQLVDDNLANYDGSIRSAMFRGYDRPITVPVTPVLRLHEEELQNARSFAEKHRLSSYKNVILFEFAPQSGQLVMTPEYAISIATEIVKNKDTAIILSSGIRIGNAYEHVMDGSVLSLRETAALTHYCTLLLGCSSGITWISTSDAGKRLPLVQMLDPYAYWVNPISRDFERFGFSQDELIELYDNDKIKVTSCIAMVLQEGMQQAKERYYKPLPLHFRSTSRGIYNMLCYLQFRAIARHIRINTGIFGWHPLLIWAIIYGFISAPFKLVGNTIKKRLRSGSRQKK